MVPDREDMTGVEGVPLHRAIGRDRHGRLQIYEAPLINVPQTEEGDRICKKMPQMCKPIGLPSETVARMQLRAGEPQAAWYTLQAAGWPPAKAAQFLKYDPRVCGGGYGITGKGPFTSAESLMKGMPSKSDMGAMRLGRLGRIGRIGKPDSNWSARSNIIADSVPSLGAFFTDGFPGDDS